MKFKPARFILFFCLLVGLKPVVAQFDVQLNFSNILFYEANAIVEYGLTDHTGLAAFGGYVYGFPDAAEPNKYFYVGVDYKFYVAPIDGIDRFYLGLYTRFKTGYYPGSLIESGQLKADPNFFRTVSTNGRVDHNKLALGLTLGSKWKSPSGFIYGFFIGGGRNVISNYSSSEIVSKQALFVPDTYTSEYSGSQWDNEFWDFRFGITIGWRIE